jgi:hypothetical protein
MSENDESKLIEFFKMTHKTMNYDAIRILRLLNGKAPIKSIHLIKEFIEESNIGDSPANRARFYNAAKQLEMYHLVERKPEVSEARLEIPYNITESGIKFLTGFDLMIKHYGIGRNAS